MRVVMVVMGLVSVAGSRDSKGKCKCQDCKGGASERSHVVFSRGEDFPTGRAEPNTTICPLRTIDNPHSVTWWQSLGTPSPMNSRILAVSDAGMVSAAA